MCLTAMRMGPVRARYLGGWGDCTPTQLDPSRLTTHCFSFGMQRKMAMDPLVISSYQQFERLRTGLLTQSKCHG